MELNQLETFLAVAEERSFSRAAVRLHRTQPAVSQVIRKLEASVGETLFDRAARDGSLTASGALLRDYALRLLALRREASSAGGCNWRPTSTPACICCRPSTLFAAKHPR
jgi:DNA-binding transcriptional LysR family regulator